jgi:ABC-type phosphate transport system auxiliary subunit
MKKIRAVLAAAVLAAAGAVPAGAQGYPVIDVAHILESIYNGYQIYQNVQNTLQQLVYSYESMKAHLQQLKTFDYHSLNSFTDAVRFADRQLNYVRNMENRFSNMRVPVGRKSVPLKRIYELPEAAEEMISEEIDFWSREMTEAEKARAWSHYGLRPVNYHYAQTWKRRVRDAAQQLAVLADAAEENMESSAREVEEITAGARESDSTVALLQANIEMQRVLAAQLMQMNYQLSAAGRLQSDQTMKEGRIPQRMPVSSDFLK